MISLVFVSLLYMCYHDRSLRWHGLLATLIGEVYIQKKYEFSLEDQALKREHMEAQFPGYVFHHS